MLLLNSTGGTGGDILRKLPGIRVEPGNSCGIKAAYSPAKNGLGQRAKIRCYSKPDTRRGSEFYRIPATGREARPEIW